MTSIKATGADAAMDRRTVMGLTAAGAAGAIINPSRGVDAATMNVKLASKNSSSSLSVMLSIPIITPMRNAPTKETMR